MKTVVARFDTRRAADLTLEHLVQDYGIERTDVFLQAAGDDNTTGERIAGADHESGDVGSSDRNDAPLNGLIELSVDLDDDKIDAVRRTLEDIGAQEVSVH